MKNFISFEEDIVERLKDIDFAEVYLTDCLHAKYKGAEPDFFEALGHVAKAFGVSKIASQKKMARSNLYKALKEGANPSFMTVVRILDAIGLKTTFVSKKSQKKPDSSITNLDETIKKLVLEVINEEMEKRQMPKAS